MNIKRHNIAEHGFEIHKNFIDLSIIDGIKQEVAASTQQYPRHGIRHANKKFASIEKLIQSKTLLNKAQNILGSKASLVRVIFFDKTPDSNWQVFWHQDKTISLSQKTNISGWGPWSIKEGVHHVQPTVDVLNHMVTFRLHLDDTDSLNGCLKVIPKSHQLGILNQQHVIDITKQQQPYLCEVQTGDLVVMRPHILHASDKSKTAKHRRVVHIEYSNYPLPNGLTWV